MTTCNVPTREEVSASSQAAFDTLQKGLGMVPNLYAAIAYSENGLSRYLAFQTAKTSLSNKEKEAAMNYLHNITEVPIDFPEPPNSLKLSRNFEHN